MARRRRRKKQGPIREAIESLAKFSLALTGAVTGIDSMKDVLTAAMPNMLDNIWRTFSDAIFFGFSDLTKGETMKATMNLEALNRAQRDVSGFTEQLGRQGVTFTDDRIIQLLERQIDLQLKGLEQAYSVARTAYGMRANMIEEAGESTMRSIGKDFLRMLGLGPPEPYPTGGTEYLSSSGEALGRYMVNPVSATLKSFKNYADIFGPGATLPEGTVPPPYNPIPR